MKKSRFSKAQIVGILKEVRDMTAAWLHRYNLHQSHESLGRIPSVGYRVKQFPNRHL